MTLQDLKNNKAEIIETITIACGAENVKIVMQEMVNGISCCNTMKELIESSIYMALEFEVKIEKSKISAILGKLSEME